MGCHKRNSCYNGRLHPLPLWGWWLIFCGSTFSQDCKRRDLCRYFLLELVNLKLTQKELWTRLAVMCHGRTTNLHRVTQIQQNQKCNPMSHILWEFRNKLILSSHDNVITLSFPTKPSFGSAMCDNNNETSSSMSMQPSLTIQHMIVQGQVQDLHLSLVHTRLGTGWDPTLAANTVVTGA